MQQNNISITGVILAGGRSRRMDGNDKGLLPLNGRSMIEYVLDAITPQVDEVLINANRNLASYQVYGHPVITDKIADFAGPLAGMAAAIQACDSDYILSVPCDGPWIPKDLVARLLSQLNKEGANISTAHDGQRLQPVFALIRRELLPAILTYLESGERRLGYWVQQQQPALTDFSDQPEAFFNVNSPAELEAAEARLNKPSRIKS
ncbi:Molybdenum cofactor guanylyltransferase [hydrothermal vent metagenome]|uniref:Molybdenum cofactor guanylyltransferase n=1 Tax=hydrothermal vent metagenome TaxID=652676 RepID=A0A3B1AUU9_9ZZZZ